MNNAKRFFGLHFSDGISSFNHTDEIGYISPEVATGLNNTMEGVPVFVGHPDDIKDGEIVGYVVKSFYNKYDGKQWCELIIFDDNAQDLIKNGWKLSNSYFYAKEDEKGHYHGVEYDFILTDGKYEHLAIVDEPRYAESIILTQEEFDVYNSEREVNIKTINSGERKMFGKLGGRNKPVIKTLNTKEFKDHKITLPKSKVEKTLNELIEVVDSYEVGGMEASLQDYIFIDDKKVTIADLIAKIDELMESPSVEQIEEEFETSSPIDSTENSEDEEASNESDEEKEENEDDVEDKDKSENKKAKNNIKSKFFNDLKNADKNKTMTQTINIKTTANAFELGRQRYGSKK